MPPHPSFARLLRALGWLSLLAGGIAALAFIIPALTTGACVPTVLGGTRCFSGPTDWIGLATGLAIGVGAGSFAIGFHWMAAVLDLLGALGRSAMPAADLAAPPPDAPAAVPSPDYLG
jgi:hypothetical protein